ncbi:hypothetical protein F4777DRAFT_368813 [Nemania sp. FL0916]|nr:hypothetical protein F4777DRAFT_368813 [Nemania sp. FL0916]
MSYHNTGESADEEIGPLRPVQRRSTLPARITNSSPSAMRRPSRPQNLSFLAMEPDRQPRPRKDSRAVNVDETFPRTQNLPVIINNYVNADSGDSEHDRSRTRPRGSTRENLRWIEGRPRSPSPYRMVISSSSEDELSYDFYNFTPSYASVSSESFKDRASSVDSHTPFLPIGGLYPPRNAKIMHIYKAQYTGDACQEGNHASRFTLLHDPRHPPQALFRWVHIEQPVLNFDAFWDEVASITNLTSSEKGGVRRLLQSVKSRGIRRVVTAHGAHKVLQTKGLPIRRLQSDDAALSTSRQRAAYWFNIPFFELKKYSTASHSSELFPAQTLMQADYSQHLTARDMQQAVRQVKEGPEEHCFHISQLWGIVVDNSLLITCSTMSDDQLSHDMISTKTSPPKEKGSESDGPRILVEYRENTLWAIPLRECLTWFAFIAHFWEFWPDNVQFYQQRKLLSSNDWPDIVASAQHGTNNVLLEAMVRPLPSPPDRGVLDPIVRREASTGQSDTDGSSTTGAGGAPVGPATTLDATTVDELSHEYKSFSVFAWIRPSSQISRAMAARSELDRIDQFLRRATRRNDQRAYIECPEASPDEIRADLERLIVEQNFLALDDRSELRGALRDRIDTFNFAIVVFTCFLPLQFVGPSTRKVWGSLKLLLGRPWPNSDEELPVDWSRRQRIADSTLYSARKVLRTFARQIMLFQEVMSHAPDSNKTGVEIPAQLLQAYIYFVLALVQASVDSILHASHMRTASSLLQEGMRTMLKSFSPASLLTYSSILPTEIISLISLRLLNDVTGPYLSISDVYSKWIKDLENEIETRPALSHQEKIQWLIAETNVIIETLEKQGSIFNEIMRCRSSNSRPVIPAQSHAPVESYFRRIAPEQGHYRTRTRTRTRTRSRERGRGPSPPPMHHAERLHPSVQVIGYDDDRSIYSADRYGRDDPDDGFQLSALDPGGFRLLLAGDCRDIVEQRLAEFKQFRRKAQALQQANAQKAETRKDYHDQAVYAFTIVTVIFLPLSAISSIFGMNTSDIRDLEQGQWLYWATAVPVTLGVILIGLWWMGELGNTALWLLNPRQRQSAPALAPRESRIYVRPARTRRYTSSSEEGDDEEELDVRIRRAPPQQVIRNTRYL